MKTTIAAAVIILSADLAIAADPKILEMQDQIVRMQQQFEKTQQEQQQQIEALKLQLEELKHSSPSSSVPEQSTTQASTKIGPKKSWSPEDPIGIRSGRSYLDIGIIATVTAGSSTASDIAGGLQLGGHDPNQRGFTLQGVEASFSGYVDPFLRANANLLFGLDSQGGSFFELEEAYAETVSLPGGLQLRGGQFLTEFGRQNATHPHSWAFVDSSLIFSRVFGPDGLRNPGARISWLVPTPFYSELFLAVQNSHGGTATSFRSGGGHDHGGAAELPFGMRHPDNDRGIKNATDMLLSPRYAVSFDLTDSQTVLLGGSAAFGPNGSGSEGDTTTQIYGLDLTWKWKSRNQSGGFPFVTWQTEGLWRRYELGSFDWDENGSGSADDGELVDLGTGMPAVFGRETISDYGFYSQILYGIKKGWLAGLRVDYAGGDRGDYENVLKSYNGGTPFTTDLSRESRWRLSPNLTWYPSEFSKVRLQYNYDHRRQIGSDHSIWLQFEFLLGAHGAHKF